MADGRFTFQSTPDESGERRDGASLLFSVPNKRLTNQTGIETRNLFFLRKEVIQPQVPLRLPCYDFTPVTNHSLGGYLIGWRTDF